MGKWVVLYLCRENSGGDAAMRLKEVTVGMRHDEREAGMQLYQ